MINAAISLGESHLVGSIWRSAGIEGLDTTFSDTKKILRNSPTNTTAKEVYFICNMRRGWQFVFDNVGCPNSIGFLREINKIVMKNLSYAPGEIRKEDVRISGTNYKPEVPIEAEILKSIDRINEIENPIDQALEFFCYVARTQMFVDGNKRVAQLIANKILMQGDAGILSIPYESIKDFKELLVDFYESNDSTNLKKFLKDNALLLTKFGEGLAEGLLAWCLKMPLSQSIYEEGLAVGFVECFVKIRTRVKIGRVKHLYDDGYSIKEIAIELGLAEEVIKDYLNGKVYAVIDKELIMEILNEEEIPLYLIAVGLDIEEKEVKSIMGEDYHDELVSRSLLPNRAIGFIMGD